MSNRVIVHDSVTGKYFLADEEELREEINGINRMLLDKLNQPVSLKELLDGLPKINP